MTADGTRLVSSLTAVRHARGPGEKHLQDIVEAHLKKLEIKHSREFPLSAKDRPDFFLDSGLVVEVKVKVGPDCLRQIFRYAQDSRVKEILVVSWMPCSRPVSKFTVDGRDKPVHFTPLWRTLL